METSYPAKVQALLKRHGYKLLDAGKPETFELMELAIPGYTSARLVPHLFRSRQSALDYLLPLLGFDFQVDYHKTLSP